MLLPYDQVDTADTPHTLLFHNRLREKRPDGGVAATLIAVSHHTETSEIPDNPDNPSHHPSEPPTVILVVTVALRAKGYPYHPPRLHTWPRNHFSLGDADAWSPAMSVPFALLTAASTPEVLDACETDGCRGMRPVEGPQEPPASAPPGADGVPVFQGNMESKAGHAYGYLEVWWEADAGRVGVHVWRNGVWEGV